MACNFLVNSFCLPFNQRDPSFNSHFLIIPPLPALSLCLSPDPRCSSNINHHQLLRVCWCKIWSRVRAITVHLYNTVLTVKSICKNSFYLKITLFQHFFFFFTETHLIFPPHSVLCTNDQLDFCWMTLLVTQALWWTSSRWRDWDGPPKTLSASCRMVCTTPLSECLMGNSALMQVQSPWFLGAWPHPWLWVQRPHLLP